MNSVFNVTTYWKYCEFELNEYHYKEKMTYLIMQQEETFELRYIDYYSASGYDAIENEEHLKKNDQDTNKLKEIEAQLGASPRRKGQDDAEFNQKVFQTESLETDLIIERNLKEIIEKKKK